jgi:hypothetical protein
MSKPRKTKLKLTRTLTSTQFIREYDAEHNAREVLRKRLENYLNKTPVDEINLEGLSMYIGVSKRTFKRLLGLPSVGDLVKGYLEASREYVCIATQNKVNENPKLTTMSIFQLKNNHDWDDKQQIEVKSDEQIRVAVTGKSLEILKSVMDIGGIIDE